MNKWQLIGILNVFFETEPEELYAVLTGSEGKKGNIYGDIFGALVERGAKGEAGLEQVQDFTS